jgi:hypothetical protein
VLDREAEQLFRRFGCLLGLYRIGFDGRRSDALSAVGAVEVLVDREQCKGLQFAERPSQLVLDPVYLMEEVAAVHVQLAAAEFPIGPQQKMVLEYLILKFIQSSAAHEAKICHELLIFQTPD